MKGLADLLRQWLNEESCVDKNYDELQKMEEPIKAITKEIKMIGKYVMARTYSAGVFAGYLKNREGKEVVLENARRIWYWSGAASLSQLATDGTSKPEECKFPVEVSEVLLTEVIEIIPITDKAKESIASVPVWKS